MVPGVDGVEHTPDRLRRVGRAGAGCIRHWP
jgi:hypothetical protein